jgi:hypothetical protein
MYIHNTTSTWSPSFSFYKILQNFLYPSLMLHVQPISSFLLLENSIFYAGFPVPCHIEKALFITQ